MSSGSFEEYNKYNSVKYEYFLSMLALISVEE